MKWIRNVTMSALLVLMVTMAGCGRTLPAQEPTGTEPHVNVEVDQDSGEIKEMPLERYVMGVVGGEMGRLPSSETGDEEQDWPEEAYAAQAILARTFIMSWIEQNPDKPISSDVTEAQAYQPDNITPLIERAVERTRGEVIHHQGKLAQTFFHSYAGGMTATAKEGLNFQEDDPGYIRSARMEENAFAPDDVKNWTASIPLSEVQSGLEEAGINVGTIKEVRIEEVGPSDRMVTVTVVGTAGTEQIHGADFRLHVGPELLKSTRVERESLRVSEGYLVAKGTGFGHGVGLSQWDAFKMARDGMRPEQIVNAFFKNIEIVKAWK